MNPDAPLLDVRDPRTHFLTDQGDVRALDGVSFTMEPGERLGVVGESGSGRSVTTTSITGFIYPPGATIYRCRRLR